MDLLLVSSSLV
uniref:Uncharacterized protein n=1 Tax=Arundo donax TaxID=35708 RepID=A0A0A8ZQL6_ARUDO